MRSPKYETPQRRVKSRVILTAKNLVLSSFTRWVDRKSLEPVCSVKLAMEVNEIGLLAQLRFLFISVCASVITLPLRVSLTFFLSPLPKTILPTFRLSYWQDEGVNLFSVKLLKSPSSLSPGLWAVVPIPMATRTVMMLAVFLMFLALSRAMSNELEDYGTWNYREGGKHWEKKKNI